MVFLARGFIFIVLNALKCLYILYGSLCFFKLCMQLFKFIDSIYNSSFSEKMKKQKKMVLNKTHMRYNAYAIWKSQKR